MIRPLLMHFFVFLDSILQNLLYFCIRKNCSQVSTTKRRIGLRSVGVSTNLAVSTSSFVFFPTIKQPSFLVSKSCQAKYNLIFSICENKCLVAFLITVNTTISNDIQNMYKSIGTMLTANMSYAVPTLVVFFRISCLAVIESNIIIATILGNIFTRHGIWYNLGSIGNCMQSGKTSFEIVTDFCCMYISIRHIQHPLTSLHVIYHRHTGLTHQLIQLVTQCRLFLRHRRTGFFL